jgi:hypothetical protein
VCLSEGEGGRLALVVLTALAAELQIMFAAPRNMEYCYVYERIPK